MVTKIMKSVFMNLCLSVMPYVLSSCGNDSRMTEWGEAKQVEVHTALAVTRASVDVFDNTPVWVFKTNDSETATEFWPAVISKSNILTFNPLHFYPLDNSMITLRGFYPKPEQEPTDGQTVLNYSLADGEADILCSQPVSGAYADPVSASMRFEHLTSQVSFYLTNDETFPIYRKITKIILTGLQTDAALDIEEGKLSFSGDKKEVVVFQAPVKDGKPDGVAPPLHSLAQVGTAKMIQPGATDIKVTFEFDSGDPIKDQPLYFQRANTAGNEAYPLQGVSYKINFILTSFVIKPDITVSEWITGEGHNMDMPAIW